MVDPDDFSRQDIASWSSQGVHLIAWINVIAPERRRLFSGLLPEKELFIRPPRGSRERTLARYYLKAWQDALARRVQELGQKGFAGLFLAGADDHHLVTDHPLGRTMMVSLLIRLAREFRAERPGSLLFLEGGLDLVRDPELAEMLTGMVVTGLWFGPGGKTVKAWEREQRLEGLRGWLDSGKQVLTAEQAEGRERVDRVRTEAAASGLDGGVASLPLRVRGR